MQKKKRRHSKRYIIRRRKRIKQLIRRVGLTVIILILCIIFAVVGRKDKKDDSIKANASIEANDKKKNDDKKKADKKKIVDSSVIVLDPGHGGKDTGTVWENTYEKEINMKIVQATADILEKDGYVVVCTREGDTKVQLEKRLPFAEQKKAKVFVSVHQNSVEEDTTSHGIETFCNEALNPNSGKLAELIQANVIAETSAKSRDLNKNSNLVVVQSEKVAACLIETGFLTSDSERKLLLSEAYQKKLASGIAKGIKAYLANYKDEISTTEKIDENSDESSDNSTENSEDTAKKPNEFVAQ